MMDVEVMTIDGKEYGIFNEIVEKDTNYVFLVNLKNEKDMMIRKSSKDDKDLYIPLEDEDEYYLATLLLSKEKTTN